MVRVRVRLGYTMATCLVLQHQVSTWNQAYIWISGSTAIMSAVPIDCRISDYCCITSYSLNRAKRCTVCINIFMTLVTLVSYLFCIIKYRPTACFTFQTVFRFSRTLVNVMGECFANETVQWCGKGWIWIEVTKMGQNHSCFLTV